eukprot:8575767-Heterocapsa_arctica.AAC.1
MTQVQRASVQHSTAERRAHTATQQAHIRNKTKSRERERKLIPNVSPFTQKRTRGRRHETRAQPATRS